MSGFWGGEDAFGEGECASGLEDGGLGDGGGFEEVLVVEF